MSRPHPRPRPVAAFLLLLAACASPRTTPAGAETAAAVVTAPASERAPDSAPAPVAESVPVAESAPVPAPAPAPAPADRSSRLPSGLYNPMPGGLLAGYAADTGLDIAGFRLPVHAIASGTLDYSEAGHTLWNGRGDSPYCVRLKLDQPIVYKGRKITHVYYAHLREIVHQQAEGAPTRIRVEGGERLGVSGSANGSPHLHLGLLLDGEVDQRWGTYLLDHEVREVLGNYRKGVRIR